VTRVQPRPSPHRWLWDEIARRFGDEAARQLKFDFDEQNRAYQHAKWHTPESPWQPRAKPPKKARKPR
jgi:hypothetical protein